MYQQNCSNNTETTHLEEHNRANYAHNTQQQVNRYKVKFVFPLTNIRYRGAHNNNQERDGAWSAEQRECASCAQIKYK